MWDGFTHRLDLAKYVFSDMLPPSKLAKIGVLVWILQLPWESQVHSEICHSMGTFYWGEGDLINLHLLLRFINVVYKLLASAVYQTQT